MTEVKSKWQKRVSGQFITTLLYISLSLQFNLVNVEARKQETFRPPTKREKRDDKCENNSFSLKKLNVYY